MFPVASTAKKRSWLASSMPFLIKKRYRPPLYGRIELTTPALATRSSKTLSRRHCRLLRALLLAWIPSSPLSLVSKESTQRQGGLTATNAVGCEQALTP